MLCGRKQIPLINLLLLLNTALALYITEDCLIQEIYGQETPILKTSENTIELWISRKEDATEIEIQSILYDKRLSLKLSDTFPEALRKVKLDFVNSSKLIIKDESGEEIDYELPSEGQSLKDSEKTLFVKNAWITKNCSHGLPYALLGSGSKEASFPIISSKSTKFVLISVAELSVSLTVNEKKLFLCWDSGEERITGQQNSSGCQNLPTLSQNLFVLEHNQETMKLKINDVQLQDNFTFDGKVLFSLEKTGHTMYVIQCFGQCPPSPSEKQSTPGDNQSSQTDDDQSSQTDDDQSSQTCHDHTTQCDGSNVTSLVLGLLLGTSTIIIVVLSYKIWRFKTYRSTNDEAYPSDAEEDATGGRASVVMSQTPTKVSSGQSPSPPRQEHHYNECVETINDIYEPFENYAIREEP